MRSSPAAAAAQQRRSATVRGGRPVNLPPIADNNNRVRFAEAVNLDRIMATAIAADSSKPPFQTFCKDGEFVLSVEKEKRFQAWKKKNMKKMKARIRPRVFEYANKPAVVRAQTR